MATLRQEHKSLYWAWKAMKQRCFNEKCRAYRNYGERGITVCDEWMRFEPFCEWALNNGYEKGLDLDRKNNSGNYTPENCRWVLRKVNINNRRKTIYIEINGMKLPRTEWEERARLPNGILKAWVENHGYEYAKERLKSILSDGYVERDYGFSHRKSLTNIDTGATYSSVREAATDVGLAPCTISNSIRENRRTSKGRFTYTAEEV